MYLFSQVFLWVFVPFLDHKITWSWSDILHFPICDRCFKTLRPPGHSENWLFFLLKSQIRPGLHLDSSTAPYTEDWHSGEEGQRISQVVCCQTIIPSHCSFYLQKIQLGFVQDSLIVHCWQLLHRSETDKRPTVNRCCHEHEGTASCLAQGGTCLL